MPRKKKVKAKAKPKAKKKVKAKATVKAATKRGVGRPAKAKVGRPAKTKKGGARVGAGRKAGPSELLLAIQAVTAIFVSIKSEVTLIRRALVARGSSDFPSVEPLVAASVRSPVAVVDPRFISGQYPDHVDAEDHLDDEPVVHRAGATS